MNYRKLNSSSKIAETKHTLMHECTTFSASRLFQCFTMVAQTGSTRYHNTLSNKISSDCTSYYIEGPVHSMHSVFAESLNLSQFKDSGTQIYTTLYYIAEINLVIGGECTLNYYIAEVFAAFLLC